MSDTRSAAEAEAHPRSEGGRPTAKGKNIVVCCDGTGNKVAGDLSNVLKLFRIARKDAKQRVFYDPGVGTIGNDSDWARLKQKARAIFGLATGAGLDENILDAYRFLASVYEPDDRIFLFGFSRGAYTVRALAGFIHMVGLLRPDQLNLADYALTAYKRSGEEDRLDIAWAFGKAAGTRRVTIHFMGVWDTVASMVVPRPDRFYLPRLRTLPFTRRNPSVRAFRHAMAIDERRRMFRLNRWDEGQTWDVNPFVKPPVTEPQDCRQLWFAGVHSDIGGGYPERQSALSKIPLIWMVEEAAQHGLRINKPTFAHLASGEEEEGSKYDYVGPDPCGEMHRSLKGFGWWLLEWLPKSTKWREWPRRSLLGFYLPRGEPRPILVGEECHQSVTERYKKCEPPYRPVNLPPREPIPPEGRAAPAMRRFVGALLLLLIAAGAMWLLGGGDRRKPRVQCECRAWAPPPAPPPLPPGGGSQQTQAVTPDAVATEITSGAQPYILRALRARQSTLTQTEATELLKSGIDASANALKSRPGWGVSFELLNGKLKISSPMRRGSITLGSIDINLYKGAALAAPALVYCYGNRERISLEQCVGKVMSDVRDKAKEAPGGGGRQAVMP